MIDKLIGAFSAHNDPAKLRAIIHEQRRLLQRLQLENAQLRAENRRLRRRLADAELRLVRQAETDALLLGGLYFAGLPTSRRAALQCGVSERHWRRAVALLQVGRVHDGQRITTQAPEDFERAVRMAVGRIERDGMDAIKWRMPRCRR